jgi:hypothetical protein
MTLSAGAPFVEAFPSRQGDPERPVLDLKKNRPMADGVEIPPRSFSGWIRGPLFLTAVAVGCLAAGICRGEAAASASTPLLTPAMEQELFSELDLSSAALAPVQKAVAQNDYPAAVRALAAYYRNRPNPAAKPLSPANDKVLAIANDAVNGRVQGGFVQLWHTFPEGKIDWHFNAPKMTPGEPPNSEWQWQLCRMYFWDNLARAYLANHDEKYARAFVEDFRSFFRQCPVPATQQNVPGSAWRTLEAGLRMDDSWPDAYYTFIKDPVFTDDDIALFLYSCRQHALYLEKFPTGGNWVATEMAGLYTVGALFPEFKEAYGWRAFAIAKSYGQETEQFLPDGAQFELSTGYHNVALDSILVIPRLAKQAGRMDELPADYVQGVEKAFDYDLFMMAPSRVLPQFNDSYVVNVDGVLKEALEFFPDRADYQWIASHGAKGAPPATTSHAFDWAGFFVMRSGWETDANYLVLRAGPIGFGHCQQDKLDVVIWAFGRQVLYSAGGGNYETSIWRNYASSTFSHNCVLVDGLP